MTSAVRIAAHAKINLFLRILARDGSGYHQIETAFALVDLADDLEVRRIDSGVTLEVEGPDLGPVADNLAVRAARAVLEATGNKFGVALQLRKRIPVRAGLGGGSSELLLLAARLGAAVAFCASGAPLALAWGRGERLFRLPAPPASPALIAVPPIAVATPDAYRWWDDANPEPGARGPVSLDAEALATWGSIGRLGGNDFESLVFAKHPDLRALYERLAGTGPVWVRLCGSGSAVAAVYKKESEREDAAVRLGERQQQLIRTATRADVAPAPQPLED